MFLRGGAGSCPPNAVPLQPIPAKPPKQVETLADRGLRCRAAGSFQEAADLFARAVLLLEDAEGMDAPELAGPLSNLAAVYRDQGRRAEAEPILQRALKLAARADRVTLAFIENNLAMLYWDRGDAARAEPLLRKAVNDSAEEVRGRMQINLASLYRTTGRLSESESLTRAVLAADPGCWQAWRNLAAIHRLRGDSSRSRVALNHALALAGEATPQRAETLFEEALLDLSLRDAARAKIAIERALTIEESLFGGDSVNLIPFVEVQAQVLRAMKAKAQARAASLRARRLRSAP
ncbi:MAG: tetratricopeptide repeat protein [Bryobacteraceae bacterium]